MSAYGYERTFTHTLIYVRFTPESRRWEQRRPRTTVLTRRAELAQQGGYLGLGYFDLDHYILIHKENNHPGSPTSAG